MVERKLPKLDVAGSIPVSRSIMRRESRFSKRLFFMVRILREVPVLKPNFGAPIVILNGVKRSEESQF